MKRKFDDNLVLKDLQDGLSIKEVMFKHKIKSRNTIKKIEDRILTLKDPTIYGSGVSKSERLNKFLITMNNIHNNRFEYPNIENEFVNAQSKITIYCKICGETLIKTLSHHIWSKSGCGNCNGVKPNTISKIIEKSKAVHGDGRYSYPNIENENITANSKITIICNKCDNIFNQQVASHLNKKNGCSRCCKSKKEQLIGNYLSSNKVEFITQYKFDGCFYKKALLFDFYIPQYNICIEYDGEQHFISRRDDKDGNRLKIQKIKDDIKNNFCKENNIRLERILYSENIQNRLKDILNNIGIIEIVSFHNISVSFSKKESKICSICKIDKKMSEYYNSIRMLDGHKSSCKECSKIKKNKIITCV